jgi:tetratricopeptide (TPR) repeat protein
MNKADPTIDLLRLVQSVMKEERWREAIRLLTENSAVVEKHWELLWNLGWCHFKLHQMEDAGKCLTKAVQLAPENFACKYGLGQVYLKTKQFKKAELILSEALLIRESDIARTSLALAYLAQGKIEDAEKAHLENIKLGPRKSARYESYAAFLSDVGREGEAEKMLRKAKDLQSIN